MVSKKHRYMKLISDMSDRYGDKLIEMMAKYGVASLEDITAEQAEEYYLEVLNG